MTMKMLIDDEDVWIAKLPKFPHVLTHLVDITFAKKNLKASSEFSLRKHLKSLLKLY